MDKGARVKIVEGNGAGTAGEIFWKGANKWGPGERLGVRGDDGETYWVADSDVELSTDKAPPQEPGETFQKGDRVAFTVRGQPGTGNVFWIGDSKNGPGQRLGVRPDGEEDAVWLDARQATRVDDAPESTPDLDSAPALENGPPPVDDATLEQWANAEEEEVEQAPDTW